MILSSMLFWIPSLLLFDIPLALPDLLEPMSLSSVISRCSEIYISQLLSKLRLQLLEKKIQNRNFEIPSLRFSALQDTDGEFAYVSTTEECISSSIGRKYETVSPLEYMQLDSLSKRTGSLLPCKFKNLIKNSLNMLNSFKLETLTFLQ